MRSRPSYQCHKIGCDSEALHAMHAHFHTLGPAADQIEMSCDCSIRVCDRHRRQAEEYLLSPENKTAISMKFLIEGLPPPDFSSLRIEWKPVVDGMLAEGAA